MPEPDGAPERANRTMTMLTAYEILSDNPSWSHSDRALKTIDSWLAKMSLGRTLNVCCGNCAVGDVRVDVDPNTARTMDGDLFRLPFPQQSFDTVICDPPFSYYNKFRWVIKLSHLARKRLILSTSLTEPKLIKREWTRELYYFSSNGGTQFLRLYWIFNRRNQNIEAVSSPDAPDKAEDNGLTASEAR
jgi:hypothetical protein